MVEWEAEQTLESFYDTLTGLPNHALVQERITQAGRMARRSQTPVSVIRLDLNQFDDVNESYGRSIGDRLVRELGFRLSQVLRESDTLSRLPGDEFAILLPFTSATESIAVCAKIAALLRRPLSIGERQIVIPGCLGAATYPNEVTTIEDLMRCAEIAMHWAKDSMASYAIYDSSVQPSDAHRVEALTELHQALYKGDLKLHFQPGLSVREGVVDHVEALVRWDRPDRKESHSLPKFIPLTDGTDIMHEVTVRVLRSAVRQSKLWLEERKPLAVSVNISKWNLHDPALSEIVRLILADVRGSSKLLEARD